MTSKMRSTSSQVPHTAAGAASFTLTDADIISQRAVPRTRLPGVPGARAAAAAFSNASDHDGPAADARPSRRTLRKPQAGHD